MIKLKTYFNWYRISIIALVFLGVCIYVATDWYWKNVCAVEICDVYFLDAYLAPLREAGLVLATVMLPFLFLPTRYFRTWFIWLFTPVFLLTLYQISRIDPNSSNMFAQRREEVVADMLLPWLILTLLFIVYHWYRTQKST